MNRELRGAYPFPFFQNSEEFEAEDCYGKIEFIGEPNRLSFITSEKSLSNPNSNFGFRAVTYYVDDDSGTEEEGFVVMENIPWSPKPFEEGNVVELDSSVVDVQFEYYICLDTLLDEGSEEECDWIDTWNPCEEEDMERQIEETKKIQTSLPKAVRITMTVKREKKSSGEYGEYEEEELPPIVIPIYSEPISITSPFGRYGNQRRTFADFLSRPGSAIKPVPDIQQQSRKKKEGAIPSYSNDPQKAAEILRQLLSGEINPNDR